MNKMLHQIQPYSCLRRSPRGRGLLCDCDIKMASRRKNTARSGPRIKIILMGTSTDWKATAENSLLPNLLAFG